MRKLISMFALAFVMFLGASTVNAQWQDDRYRQDDRYDQGRGWRNSQIQTVREFRDIRVNDGRRGVRVFREHYVSKYRIRQRRNGAIQRVLLSRVYVGREELTDWRTNRRYGRNGSGIRFNIYLPF